MSLDTVGGRRQELALHNVAQDMAMTMKMLQMNQAVFVVSCTVDKSFVKYFFQMSAGPCMVIIL